MGLTPEQLNLLTRLQPLFKEKMGEWQIRDEGWTEGLGMGVLYHNGLTYFDNGTRINPMWCDEILRIPKPIDWQNPERGLCGMLVGEKRLSYFNDLLSISERYMSRVDHYYTKGNKTRDWHVIAEDPFTALLKALCEQEGV